MLCLFLSLAGRAQKLDLSLEDCLGMALLNDVSVRNARLDVLASRAQKQEAAAEYFPKVFVSSYGFMALDPLLQIGVKDILGPGFDLPFTYSSLKSGFAASLTAIQPLYAGGRIVAGNRLAELGEAASAVKDEMAVRDVMESVEKDYWKVVALEEKAGTLDASEAFLANLSADVAAAAEAGLVLDTDLMQVELKRNELKRLRLSLTGGIRLAKMNLLDAIGQDYSLIPALAGSNKPHIDSVFLSGKVSCLRAPGEYHVPEEEILEGLSEARLLDMSVEEKTLRKNMTLGDALPQVGVGASYGYSQILNSRFNGIVFAMLRIPVSDWGKVSRRVQRMDHELQKARNDREHLREMLLLQIRSLWLDLNVAWENVSLARDGAALARKTADMMLARYEAGLVSLSDLLEARAGLRSACDACTDAETAYVSSLAAYLSLQK